MAKSQQVPVKEMFFISHAEAHNKPLKALALLAGTLTHGLRHFVSNFSPCIIAP